MPDGRTRPRVTILAGGWPADDAYLGHLASAVDLHFYHSSWLPDGRAKDVIAPAGVTSQTFEPIVRSERGHPAFVFSGLRTMLNRDRPDIVHVISEPWGFLSVQAALWVRRNRASTRLVVHGCDTIWHHGRPIKRLARRMLLRLTMGVADGFVAENSQALGLARANGLRPDAVCARIHTNPRDGAIWRPPTAEERARARADLHIEDGTVAVGILGRLVPQKGIRQFLDAADSLAGAGGPVRFFVAGDGPLRHEVERRRSAHVVGLGTLSHPGGVRGLLWGLDVLACPSLSTPTWEDQGPRSMLEAMMCGCVPIATPTGGLPEMLGGHGVLSAGVDSASIANAIAAAIRISNGPQRWELAKWAHGQYSDEAASRQLTDLWSTVSTVRGPSRSYGGGR